MMADEWFTDTPGCLQSFGMRPGVKRDIPRLLAHWRGLIDRKDEIKDFVPGHWNGDLSHDGFVERYEYVQVLYDGVGKAAAAGTELSELFTEFDIAARFPGLVDTPGFTRRFVHNGTLVALWADVTGQTSASEALATAIEEKAPRAAVAEIVADHGTSPGKYYFLEHEFNQLGYRYLGEERYDPAIAVFQANVDMYPESWNVYDSLGEAFMKNGQIEAAIRNYETSMKLNPDNENGKQMLEELRGVVAGS